MCVEGCCVQCATNADCAIHEVCEQNTCVVPQGIHDIRIVLTWTNQLYPTPQQGYGVDLDLHYRHPLGRWNASPYSVYWGSVMQDWGVSGAPSIAKLVRDDMYGIGPEEITHNNPVDGYAYSVGVYYYTDRGYGAAEATIEIFVRDTLVYTKTRSMPATGYFWHVASIQWPSGQVYEHDAMQLGFPP